MGGWVGALLCCVLYCVFGCGLVWVGAFLCLCIALRVFWVWVGGVGRGGVGRAGGGGHQSWFWLPLGTLTESVVSSTEDLAALLDAQVQLDPADSTVLAYAPGAQFECVCDLIGGVCVCVSFDWRACHLIGGVCMCVSFDWRACHLIGGVCVCVSFDWRACHLIGGVCVCVPFDWRCLRVRVI